MIKVGVESLKYTEQNIRENPLQLLYESYVHANKQAETDPTVLVKAKLEFNKLENGSEAELKSWRNYMQYTIQELEHTYERLGVRFDEYNYESMYSAKDIKDVIDLMNEKKILSELPDGKQVAKVDDRDVSVIKSDGSTLYLTRDIAAAIDRFTKHDFDRMFYVVENGQNDHFNALKGILHQMDYGWVHRIRHVKFGRVRGMSTRKGNVVFLKDILDETRDLMKQRQIDSPSMWPADSLFYN